MAPQFRYLDELYEYGDYKIHASVCRKWDTYSLYGTYLSTDYILADSKENVIHCTTKNKVSHMFIDRLAEGFVYSFRQFKVLPNRTTFPLTASRHMLELHGTSMVKKIDAPATGFPRYAFNLTPIQTIKFEENGGLIDVAGYDTDVGQVVAREIGKGKKIQKISQALDFFLLSTDGYKIRVMLWGDLYNLMLEKRPPTAQAYPLLLVGMQVKSYKDTCLSSTSATILYDDPEIPVLSLFARDKPRHEAIQVPPTQLTLRQLSEWCQTKKKDANFHCSTRIKEVNTENPWFKVQLKVEDPTHSAWITLFDDTAEALFNASVDSFLRSQRVSKTGELPTVLLNMIGTTHVLEIPSQSYFPHGGENYTCIGITPALEMNSQDSSYLPVGNAEASNVGGPNGANSQLPAAVSNNQGTSVGGSNGVRPSGPAVVNGTQDAHASGERVASVDEVDGSPREVGAFGGSQEAGGSDEDDDGAITQASKRQRKNVVVSSDEEK